MRFTAHLVEPQIQPLIGFPQEWSSGTKGPVTADVVRVQIANEADFAKYRGKLAGKIVLTQPARAVRMLEGPIILRMTDKDIAEAETTPVPAAAAGGGRAGRRSRGVPRRRSPTSTCRKASSRSSIAAATATWRPAAATCRGSSSIPTAGRSFRPAPAPRDDKAGKGVPVIALAVEHYNRMIRVLDKGVPVKVELNVETKFYDENTPNGFNTIAEIPGHRSRVGDRAARRALRLASVRDRRHRQRDRQRRDDGGDADPEGGRREAAPHDPGRRCGAARSRGCSARAPTSAITSPTSSTMTLKPEHAKLSAYFNSDNGTGKVRGIWLQSNMAARPIFEQWMAPLHDLGVTTIGPRSVTSTDHVSFDNAGIPAFQFMVDRLEYNSRTHHSNMDTFDRVQRDDMVQQATVIAVFAYNAAMRDEKLPRKALPAPQTGVGRTVSAADRICRSSGYHLVIRTAAPGASSARAARRAAGSRASRRTGAASCRSGR